MQSMGLVYLPTCRLIFMVNVGIFLDCNFEASRHCVVQDNICLAHVKAETGVHP